MSTANSPRTTSYYAAASLGGLVLLLVWMQGGFTTKVGPGTVQAAEVPVAPPTVAVSRQEVAEVLSWPATVTARKQAQLAPKVPGRIETIPVKVGEPVRAGQVLVRLDDRELQARLAQARSAAAAAGAEAGRAHADAARIRNLFAKEAATRQSLDLAEAQARSGGARAAEARAAIAEAESVLGEALLKAPFDGTVVERLRDPGDLATPNAPVLTLQSAEKLRVETDIPDHCAGRLVVGSQLLARVGASRHPAVVEEIAPSADVRSRTVHVKAGLADATGLQAGSFAWIDQECGSHPQLLVPAAAVSRSGQLESVRLLVKGRPMLRHVRTGKAVDGRVEVLSGLKEGDQVVLERTK
jgi:RND family efflux transporter MFP subunit